MLHGRAIGSLQYCAEAQSPDLFLGDADVSIAIPQLERQPLWCHAHFGRRHFDAPAGRRGSLALALALTAVT